MNQKYRIKNFRAFDNKGVEFDIKPITILTGCNSSGKSSLVKSLLLLDDFFQKYKEELKARRGRANLFSKYFDFNNPILKLGKFDTARNYNSCDSEDMEFSYSFEGLKGYGMDIFMTLFIKSKKDDFLNNGWLSAYEISQKDGSVIFRLSRNGHRISLHNLDVKAIVPVFLEASNTVLFEKLGRNYSVKGVYAAINGISHRSVVLRNLDSLFSNSSEIMHYIRNTFGDNGNIEVLISMINEGVFFYIPNLTILSSKTKEKTISFISSYIAECKFPYLKHDLEILLQNFNKSYFEDLYQFLKYEQDNFIDFLQNNDEELQIDGNEYFTNSLDDIIIDSHFNGLLNYYSIVNTDIDIEFFHKYHPYLRYIGSLNVCLSDKNTHEFHSIDVLFPLRMLLQFIDYQIISKIDYPYFSEGGISYISSEIMEVKRSYEINSNANFAGILKKYHDVIVSNSAHSSYDVGAFINRWIKKFGIGDRFEVKNNESGMNLSVYIYANPTDKKGHLLADEGYGISQLLSLLMQIEIAIVKNNITRKKSFKYKFENNKNNPLSVTIAVEEPEIHLHPKLQSLIAEMVVDAYNLGVHFIIETHSEYLIRRLQTLVAQKSVENTNVIVYYMYDPKQEDIPDYIDRVKEIKINEDGSLTDSFGSGFFDESYNLSNELLKVKLGLL